MGEFPVVWGGGFVFEGVEVFLEEGKEIYLIAGWFESIERGHLSCYGVYSVEIIFEVAFYDLQVTNHFIKATIIRDSLRGRYQAPFNYRK